MKLVSWNVNGLRACMGKGFEDYFRRAEADFFCLQETKMQPGQAEIPAEGYHLYMNSAEKKGYSGTAIFAKEEPLAVSYGIGLEEHDREGRVITLEYPEFQLVTVYTPNSQRGLTRLDYRMTVGGRFPGVSEGAGRKEAGHLLRRPERGAPGDRPEEPQEQHAERGLHAAGAAEDDGAAGGGIYRYLPVSVSGQAGCVFLVELYVPCPGEQRGMADRLFSLLGADPGPDPGGDDRNGGLRIGSLPGDADAGDAVKKARLRRAGSFIALFLCQCLRQALKICLQVIEGLQGGASFRR